jgi:Spy/CpxP family protein refolding chaperone
MSRVALSTLLLVIAGACAHAGNAPTTPTTPTTPTAPTAPTPPTAAPPAAPAAPSTAPTAPTPPTPPAPPKSAGISVRIHDGKVDIAGVQETVDRELSRAVAELHATLAHNKDLTPETRAKLEARLEQMRGKIQRRLAHVDAKDLDHLGDELGEMGEEIGKMGEDIGNEIANHVTVVARGSGHDRRHVDVNDDDDDELGDAPDVDDTDSLDEAVRDLGGLKLAPEQHQKLAKLRADSDRRAAAAKEALHAASQKLHDQIATDACDDDISKSIDAVSRQEAELRKARVLAWTGARRLLDDVQRKRIEAAATKKSQ